MTVRDIATWSKVVNIEESMLLQLTNTCLKISDFKEDGDKEDHGQDDQVGFAIIFPSNEKRKYMFEQQGNNKSALFACQNARCSQSELALGFIDKNSRIDHELQCIYY